MSSVLEIRNSKEFEFFVYTILINNIIDNGNIIDNIIDNGNRNNNNIIDNGNYDLDDVD